MTLDNILNYSLTISEIILFGICSYFLYMTVNYVYTQLSEFNRKITTIARCAEVVIEVHNRHNLLNIQNPTYIIPNILNNTVPAVNNPNNNRNIFFNTMVDFFTPSQQTRAIYSELFRMVTTRYIDVLVNYIANRYINIDNNVINPVQNNDFPQDFQLQQPVQAVQPVLPAEQMEHFLPVRPLVADIYTPSTMSVDSQHSKRSKRSKSSIRRQYFRRAGATDMVTDSETDSTISGSSTVSNLHPDILEKNR